MLAAVASAASSQPFARSRSSALLACALRIGAVERAKLAQSRAAREPRRWRRALRARERHRIETLIGQCARHQHCRFAGVVVERSSAFGNMDIRRQRDDAGKYAFGIEAGSPQRGTGTVRQAGNDHARVLRRERCMRRKARSSIARPNSAACNTCRPQSASGLSPECACLMATPLVSTERARFEFQHVVVCTTEPALGLRSARAVERDAGLRVEIVVARSGALVGVRDREAARQSPRAGQRNRTVHAARTGRRGHHEAARLRVERIGNLHEHAMRRCGARNARERRELATRHCRRPRHRRCRNRRAGRDRRCRASSCGSRGVAIPAESEPSDRRMPAACRAVHQGPDPR